MCPPAALAVPCPPLCQLRTHEGCIVDSLSLTLGVRVGRAGRYFRLPVVFTKQPSHKGPQLAWGSPGCHWPRRHA
jgi:hypothetical protein